MDPISFDTHPSRYKHWKLQIDGQVATLAMYVQNESALRPGYELKLNSYDLSVDIELADAVQRLRFEHPGSARGGGALGNLKEQGLFCSGANIFMLSSLLPTAFKVNFCKYTNETRLGIEEASANPAANAIMAALQRRLTAGGGYELGARLR